MKKIVYGFCVMAISLTLSACGDKKDSATTAQEAQKAIQEGMQKEKSMMEGMVKGVETMEKKMTEPKEETKK
jgi:outer membrane lipoprotein-sorting protein